MYHSLAEAIAEEYPGVAPELDEDGEEVPADEAATAKSDET